MAAGHTSAQQQAAAAAIILSSSRSTHAAAVCLRSPCTISVSTPTCYRPAAPHYAPLVYVCAAAAHAWAGPAVRRRNDTHLISARARACCGRAAFGREAAVRVRLCVTYCRAKLALSVGCRSEIASRRRNPRAADVADPVPRGRDRSSRRYCPTAVVCRRPQLTAPAVGLPAAAAEQHISSAVRPQRCRSAMRCLRTTQRTTREPPATASRCSATNRYVRTQWRSQDSEVDGGVTDSGDLPYKIVEN